MWAVVMKALLLLWRSKLVRAQAVNLAVGASRRVIDGDETPVSRAMATPFSGGSPRRSHTRSTARRSPTGR
jgi:hypothetical protein